ncbi:PP2C family protein-serine/threonine phosphatase [Alteromonas lipotrueae]|uniref:PP2C family protein-serine/threonine phosphatase n=1 Tax=Alteromonas lipotrueae TaxID=2803814 RepID=UPI001C438406|nr:PP2C family serine/threonine-protein phosphatase [Alteromonas lipotrueae]
MYNKFRVFSASHIGHRDENQDAHAVLTKPQYGEFLCVVADGMGGHKGGAFAAKKVVDICTLKWNENESIEEPENFLTELAFFTHSAIVDSQIPEFAQAQSLVCMLYVNLAQSIFMSMHVGDCRTFQFKNESFVKRTVDQSLAQLHALKGDISDDEIASHPDQNKIYSSLGGSEPPSPLIESYEKSGNVFLVCSDGFWELFTQQALGEALENIESDKDLETLIQQQLANKSQHDNTTAILVKLCSEETTGSGQKPQAQYGIKSPVTELHKAGSTESESNRIEVSIEENIDSTQIHSDLESSTLKSTAEQSSHSQYKLLLGLGVLIILIALGYYFLSRPNSIDSASLPHQKTSKANSSDANPSTESKQPIPTPRPDSNSPTKQQDNLPLESAGKSSKEVVGTDTSSADSGNIQTRRSTPDIPVSSIDDAIKKTEETLREEGGLGEDDELKVATRGREIGDSQVIKLQQFYKGLPVYGAETITLVRENKIASIDSKTLNDINIDTSPALSADEAFTLAQDEVKSSLRMLQQAQLIIFKKGDNYLLVWRAEVEKATGEQVMLFLDSTNALIVEEISLHISEGLVDETK